MSKIKCFLVGLAGGSASGKTTFITRLKEKFSDDELCVISQDHYYKPKGQQLVDENGVINFDHPVGIDTKRLARDIRRLKKGQSVSIVEYTFNNPKVFPKNIVFKPCPIILVEGLFVYADKTLKNLFDWKLYIVASKEVTLKRRLKRDKEERSIDEEMVRYQWDNHFMPAYKKYLEPHKKDMNLLINNDEGFEDELNMVEGKFREIINLKS